jgi:CRP-like cAMP-binding protein
MISIMSEFDALWTSARLVSLKRGGSLFRAGDPVRSMFRVNTGSVGLERSLPNGTFLILQTARPGSMLAEASLFAPRYHCDATAQQDSIVARIPKAKVIEALADPLFALPLIQKMAQDVQATRMRAEILALRTVAERLEAWLLFNGPGLPAKGRWRTLAAELAVSPEALYREIAKRRVA